MVLHLRYLLDILEEMLGGKSDVCTEVQGRGLTEDTELESWTRDWMRTPRD